MRGVFWLIEDEILAVPYKEGVTEGLSKSGDNYNHRLIWDHAKPKKCNKPFDYYPRGRVELDNKGRVLIYMNSAIDESFLPQIKEAFDISGDVRIHYDGSKHYKCHLDEKR